jgi:hypothetical protein
MTLIAFNDLFLAPTGKLYEWLCHRGRDRYRYRDRYRDRDRGGWAKNHILACRSDPTSPIWTKIGTTKQLDPKNQPVTAFLKFRKIDLARRGQRSKFDQISLRNHVLACRSDPVSPMWTKIGTNKRLDPKNKPITAFLKFRKIDLTRRGQRSNFDKI